MANYREEWVRFTQCFHDFDSLVLTVGAAEPEKTVLILIDNPEDEDLDAGRVMAPARMNTFKAVLGRALFELQKDKVKLNVRFVLSAVVNSQDSLNYGKTLTTLISRVRPDTVIGMGMRVNKTLVTDGKYLTYFGRPYPAHVTKEKKTKDVKIKFDLIPSVPTWGWTDPKPAIKDENGGGMVNMIGQVIKHFKTAVTGQCEGTIYVKDNNPPFTFIDTIKKFDKFLKQLKKTRIICMDTEGTGLGVITSEIISVQFCLELRDKKGKQIMDKESLYFLPLNHYQTPWTATEIQYIKDKLQHFFEKGKTKYIIFQNGKYDVLQFYSNLGVRWFNHRLYDTQAGEFTLDENWKFSSGLGYRAYALESIENRYGYYRTDLAISKADRSNMAAKPLMDIANYGMIDVVTPFLIHEEQLRIAEKRGYNKFLLVVADQIGNMILVFSIMEHNGMPVDIAYLQTLQSEDSKLNQTVNNMLESFKESKAANRVNDRLLGDRNYQEDGMFGKVEKPWLFDINTQDHAQKLFIEELKLKPIHTGANGKASLDDKFQSKYKDVPEVAVMSQYSKAKKIKTGFSEALYSRLLTDPDAVKDGHIRSVYKYLQVVTGRSSSTNPNLQNQPERGEFAKLIKRIFCVPKGEIVIKADFSAHEVRGFGNIALDSKIGQAFEAARKAIFRVRLSKKKDLPEAKAKMATEGDIHIQNVKLFFNQIVDKGHHLRYAIKAIVFGVLYGKMAKALSNDINNDKSETARLRMEMKIIKKLLKK